MIPPISPEERGISRIEEIETYIIREEKEKKNRASRQPFLLTHPVEEPDAIECPVVK